MRHTTSAVVILMILATQLRADETAAVKAIEKLGGKVTVDETKPGKPVVGVFFIRGEHVTDAVMKDVNLLTHLRRLFLLKSQMTDAGLKDLKNLTDLAVCGKKF